MNEVDNETWSILCIRVNEVQAAIVDAATAHHESDFVCAG